MTTVEIALILVLALIIGVIAAKVIGKTARIGFYILLGLTLLALAWFLFQ